MSTTPAILKPEDQTCCFWMNHSEGCAHVKHGAASIVAALAAIAILGGVLLILAQQGFDLAGINSIAQMVESKWIYLGLGSAAGVLVIDTVFIIAQVHSYLNKTYSNIELEDIIDIDGDHEANKARKQLDNNTFAFLEIPAEKGNAGKPPVYIVFSKDENGTITQLPFRDQADALVHIERLKETQAYEDGIEKFANSPTYPRSYVEKKVGERELQAKEEDILRDVRPKNFLVERLSTPGNRPSVRHMLSIWMVALRTSSGEAQVIYYKSTEAVDAALENEFSSYISQNFIDGTLKGSISKHVLAPLAANQHWQFELSYGDERTCYAMLVANASGEETVYPFFTATERTMFLQNHHPLSTNAQPLFAANASYTETEVLTLCTPEDIDAFKAVVTKTGVYSGYPLPMRLTRRPELKIYALSVGHDDPTLRTYHYFKTLDLCKAYVTTHLSEQINRTAIMEAIEETFPGNVKTYMKNGDYWPLTLQVGERTVYAVSVMVDEDLEDSYWLTAEARAQAFQPGNLFGNVAVYRNFKEFLEASRIQRQFLIPMFVKGVNDYWVAQVEVGFGAMHLVYFQEDGKLTSALRPENEVAAFLTSKNLHHDISAAMKGSSVFPEDVGAFLLTKAVKDNKTVDVIKEQERLAKQYLSEGEFIQFEEVPVDGLAYGKVFVLFVHNTTGDFKFHYFKTADARNQFIANLRLENGYSRHEHQYHAVRLVGKTFYESQVGEKKPLVFTFDRPDGKASCFITYSNGKSSIREYVPTADVASTLQEKVKTHVHIALGKLVSEEEKTELNKAADFKSYITDGKGFTKALSFTYKSEQGYHVLYVRHADKQTPEREVFYFRTFVEAQAKADAMSAQYTYFKT